MSEDSRNFGDQLENDLDSGINNAANIIPKANQAIQGARGKLPSRPSGSQGGSSKAPPGDSGQGDGNPQAKEGGGGQSANSNDKGGQNTADQGEKPNRGEKPGGGSDKPGEKDGAPEGTGKQGKDGAPKPGGVNQNQQPGMGQPSNPAAQPAGIGPGQSGAQEKSPAEAGAGKAQGTDGAGGKGAPGGPTGGKGADKETGKSATGSEGAASGGGSKSPNSGASSGGSSGGGGAGSGSAGGAAGSGGGAAGSTGGAAAGSGGGAAAGSAAGAGGGAATGAAAGSAAGPVGTAAGAVAGAVIVPLIKLIIKIGVVAAVLICVFCMHPSTLYDFPQAIIEREALEDTYNSFYENIEDEYRKDIRSAKQKARGSTTGYNAEMKEDPETELDDRIFLSEDDLEAVQELLDDDDLDRIVYESPVTEFTKTDEELLEAMSGNINMVISMLDVKKDSWFVQLAKWILNSWTGGWYSKFTDGVARWWEGLWNDFVIHELAFVEAEVWIEEEWDDEDDDEPSKRVGHIRYTFTYDLRDLGIGFYVEKLGLTEDEVNKAAEMSHYLGDLFGSLSDQFTGWYTEPGSWNDPVSGGNTGQRIKDAIDGLDDNPDYDENATEVFPLQGYTNPRPSSWFGPRNFAPDPFHTGIDFAAPLGTPIVAIRDGVVLYTDHAYGSWGKYIVIYHGGNVSTMYAHMNAFGQFKTGDEVRAGDVIGYVGRTGLSTGPHLHFQLNIGNQAVNPVGYFEVFDYLRS